MPGCSTASPPRSGRTASTRFVVRYGKWFRLTSADITKAERWFDKRAVVGVLLGRCVPLVRSLVSIPAGFRRMPFATFTLYTAIGSLIWNTALIGAGYLLRENWHDVEPILDVDAVHRHRRHRRRRSAGSSGGASSPPTARRSTTARLDASPAD